jgi:hypothetical protein
MNYVIDKLKEVFETTVESGIKYEGSLETPDYYGLFCKAAAQDQLYKLMGNNLCMFNCDLDHGDAVMMLFSIPINTSEESGAKNVAERVMEVVQNIESCFVTLDELKSEQVQEDKFVYVTAIKKLNGGKE